MQCALPTQVAAAMLAARAEGKTSPLQTMLPVEAGAAAMLAWQQAVRTRSAKKVKEYQREVWLLVRKMGMQVRGEAGPGRGGLRAWTVSEEHWWARWQLQGRAWVQHACCWQSSGRAEPPLG